MPVKLQSAPLSRRSVLRTGAAASATFAAGGLFVPAISRTADRPVSTHDLQSGDVNVSSGMVWARTDCAVRMTVEWSITEDFANATRMQPLDLIAKREFCRQALPRQPALRPGHLLPVAVTQPR